MQPDAYELDKKKAVLDLLTSHQSDSRLEKAILEQKLGLRFKSLLQVAQLSPWWSQVMQDKTDQIRQVETISALLDLFPVLTRIELQNSGKQLWTKPNLDLDDKYWKYTTSGSTGKPVSVIRQIKSHQTQQAAIELLDVVWQDRDLTKATASLKISPDNNDHAGLGTPFNYFGSTGPAYTRSLVNNTTAQLLDFLAEKHVKNVLVNASVLKFLIKEQFRLPRSNAKIEQIMTWADRLDPALRIQAKEVFGAKICDRYSSTEFGFLAIQCPSTDHLHTLQFNNFIEILNNDDKPCKIGEPGRVVVTSLQNFAMPLIRYELGDVAAFAPPCDHGINLPVLEPLIVRTRESLLLEDGSLEIPYLDGIDLAKHPDTKDFQAYRFNDGLVIVFSATSEIEETVLENSASKLKVLFKSADRISFVQLDSLDWLGLWKRKMIMNVSENVPRELTQEYFENLEIS